MHVHDTPVTKTTKVSYLYNVHHPYVDIIFGGLVACLAGVFMMYCPLDGDGTPVSNDDLLTRTGTGGGGPGLEPMGVVGPIGDPVSRVQRR